VPKEVGSREQVWLPGEWKIQKKAIPVPHQNGIGPLVYRLPLPFSILRSVRGRPRTPFQDQGRPLGAKGALFWTRRAPWTSPLCTKRPFRPIFGCASPPAKIATSSKKGVRNDGMSDCPPRLRGNFTCDMLSRGCRPMGHKFAKTRRIAKSRSRKKSPYALILAYGDGKRTGMAPYAAPTNGLGGAGVVKKNITRRHQGSRIPPDSQCD
jgi:hypothetical protein